MKHVYTLFLIITTLFTSIALEAQIVYHFTTAGAEGQFGPTQGELDTEYFGTNLQGSVTSVSGIQEWQVPTSGTYSIEARGAQGYGSFGGRGASITGEFLLQAGDVLRILVGQKGAPPVGSGTNQYGGGGGSFVTDINDAPLVVAGGGGGSWATSFNATTDASITTSGNTGGGTGSTGGAGGTGGMGGGTASSGDGGGGLLGDGQGTAHGKAFVNGGAGGIATSSGGEGGFGGGGGASSWDNRRGGGGGGYSGGGGAHGETTGFPEGGGGGSYNDGANPVNLDGFQLGDGEIIITLLTSPVPNEVGASSINSPAYGSCAGTYPFEVTVSNFGNNQINTVDIEWSINGGAVQTQTYNGLIDTINGTGSANVTVNLGNITINGNTDIIVWTTMPNGMNDTVNQNDTSHSSFFASDPQIDLGELALCDGNFEIINVADPQWVSYEWNTGSTNPQIVVTNPGMYAITVIDSFNCPATDSVDVQNGVTPVVNLGSELEGCDMLTLNAGTPNGTYAWSNNETTQTITVTESGNYFVTVTSEHGCIGEGGVGVTIHESPEINIGPDQTICVDLGESALLGVSNNYEFYQWNTGQSSNAIVINGTQGWPLQWNDFYLTVIDENGCAGSDTARIRLRTCIPAGASEIANSDGFKAFPNPANDLVTLQFAENISGATIRLLDVSGRVISSQIKTGSSEILDVSLLGNGVYYISVIADNETFVQELMVN